MKKGKHPTPWRVEYWRRCPEWHERSCPRVVDANGATVLEMPQSLGHPGEYDEAADETAQRIVAAVNGRVFVVLDHRHESDQLRHQVAYPSRETAEVLAKEIRECVECPNTAIEVVELKWCETVE